MAVNTDIILYILLGGIAGIIYALKRVFILERKIDDIDKKIAGRLGIGRKKG